MKKTVLLILPSLLFSCLSIAQQFQSNAVIIHDSLLLSHMPEWAKSVLEKSEIAKRHTIQQNFNPFYLESDFNGDKMIDIAFFVENTLDHTKGVLIINGGKNLVYVVGCGNSTEMGSSIAWAKYWKVYRKNIMRNPARKAIALKTPAIMLEGKMENSLIVYWDRNKYKTLSGQN